MRERRRKGRGALHLRIAPFAAEGTSFLSGVPRHHSFLFSISTNTSDALMAAPLQRKRQAELDIVRLRKELSATKSSVATLRLPLQPVRAPCKKFL
ncbi:hypothetical protein EVAR_16834_1 [Eumeta japonica]|uniref:Uncharacterized protein n=1 Tax=Eumeta variegata TaxID=151549 RepID=A0A4C1V341_EUMVA|nr:hypothetical protein EVAR_16834_1 [Eumeta japonica]